MTAARLLLALLSSLPALAALGCGGGGGSGGGAADESLVSGDYYVVAVGAFDSTPDRAQSLWGVLTSDGAGGLTGSYGSNFGTAVTPVTLLPTPTTYAVGSDRATTFVFGGSTTYTGWADASGDLVVTGNLTIGDQPAFLALARTGSGLSNASLNGDYRYALWGVNDSGDAFSASGTATFAGDGTGQAALTENVEGTVSTAPSPLPAAYGVNADGQLTLDFVGIEWEGLVFRSGEVVVAAGSTTDTEVPLLVVFVKEASGTSDATFSGTYQLVGIERDGGGFTGVVGTVASAGSGSATATFTRNEDGLIVTPAPDTVTYGITADGGMAIDPTGGDGPVGGITADGRFAFLGGPVSAGSSPSLYLLLRR